MKNTTNKLSVPAHSIRTLTPSELRLANGGRKAGGDQQPGPQPFINFCHGR